MIDGARDVKGVRLEKKLVDILYKVRQTQALTGVTDVFLVMTSSKECWDSNCGLSTCCDIYRLGPVQNHSHVTESWHIQ